VSPRARIQVVLLTGFLGTAKTTLHIEDLRTPALAPRGAAARADSELHMKILVTGASGFVGVNLVAALLSRGHEVLAFSADAIPVAAVAGWRSVPGNLTEATGDVCDSASLERLMREHAIEAVWHGAAITAGPEREKREPRRILEVNLLAPSARWRQRPEPARDASSIRVPRPCTAARRSKGKGRFSRTRKCGR
jgi:FlaA1/EpsC-like NDP-sugar epimerase